MEDGDLYIERRKHSRIDTKCKVSYKVITASEEVEEIRKSVTKTDGESSDISLGGVKVSGEVSGKSGDIIRLEILIEGKETITTFAEIKWVKGAGSDQTEFGLEFLILKDKDRQIIEEISLL